MISIQAHFDGKVIVPHDPLELPPDQTLIVRIETVSGVATSRDSCLNWLADHAVDSAAIPTDLSHEHDHYLYGSPKRNA